MRVLLLTAWYPSSEQPFAGVFVREQARALRAVGVDVEVLHVPAEGYRHRGLWHLEQETDAAIAAGFPTYRLTSRRFSLPRLVPAGRRIAFWASYGLQLLALAATLRRLRRQSGRPDLIHAHVFDAAALAVAIRRFHRLPIVATEHSSQFPRGDIGAGQLKRARRAFLGADRVLTVSSSLRESIESYGIHARFDVVPNPVDTSVFHPGEAGGWVGGRDVAGAAAMPRLLFVGRLEPTDHKGLGTLLAAMARLARDGRRMHLDVVGEGPSRGDFESAARERGMAEDVTFHGALPRQAVADAMRRADLFVLPSLSETQGVAIVEALACGLPVVSTVGGAIPEAVSAADGLLVEPRDADQLARALERVLSGQVAFDRPAIAGRAQARYGMEAVGGRLRAIYGEVLAERKADRT